VEIRSYVSEPGQGPAHVGREGRHSEGAERQAVYANRRRIRGARGKRLLRKRGELLERPFAHCYETGAMRRTHLRGHANIFKRLLVHVAGFNLAMVMRARCSGSASRAGCKTVSRPSWAAFSIRFWTFSGGWDASGRVGIALECFRLLGNRNRRSAAAA